MQKIITKHLENITSIRKNIKRHLTGEEKILMLSFKNITISFGILISGFLFSNSVFADSVDYTVNVSPSLNISLSGDTEDGKLVLNLNPNNKTSDSKDLIVKVGTNNITGYKLIMSTVDDSSDLVRDNTDNLGNATIPTLTTGTSFVSLTDFPTNKWGYKKDDSDFIPFVSNTKLLENHTATNEDSTTLTFASKIDYSQMAGRYAATLAFIATANPTSIETIGTMQALGKLNSAEKEWVVNNMEIEKSYELEDARDGRQYYIAKLKDGNVWMVQNLRLGQDTNSLPLTTTDSDVPDSGFTLNGKLSNNKFTYTTVNGTNRQNNNSQYYCTEDYGCYYNWYTATAGSGTTSVSSGEATNSICPKGWTLPTGGNSGQWNSLYTAYGSSAKNFLVSPTNLKENIDGASAPGLLLGGYYGYLGASFVGSRGYYWSRTAYSAQDGYTPYLSTSEVYPVNNTNKYAGLPVRCVFK